MPTESGTEPRSLAVARDVLEREAQAILALAPRIGESFEQAVRLILETKGKVIITAIGKSGHIGRKIAGTMASTGTPAFFVHPTEALHGDLGLISAGDVVIAISHSGATAELLTVLPVIAKIGAPVIAIARSADSPLGRAAQVCLETNVDAEADTLNLAPTASTTVTLALGDALAVALLRERGFRSEDFAQLHPGGALGKRLVRVSEIVTGRPNPTVPGEVSVQEAIVKSKDANLGAVSIVTERGTLAGILTDGDIGRLLRNHRGEELLRVLESPVGSVVGGAPRAISGDTMGEAAVQLMEEMSTYVLPVLDAEGRVMGMLRMHDLIKAGFTFTRDTD